MNNKTKNTVKTKLYIGAAILACITVTIATTTAIFATSDTTRPYLTAATYVTNDDNTETITVTFNEPVWFDAAGTDNNLISEEFTCTEGGRSEETGGFELRVRGRRLAINSVSLPTTEEGASVTVTITAASFGTSSPRLEYYPFTNQVAYCSSGDFNLLEEADFQIRDVAENMARGKVVSTRRAAEVTTTDATVPTIITQDITSSNANSAYAKAGDTLTLTFMTSETLSQTPTVQIAGNSTEVTPNGNTYTATYMVTTDTPDGAVTYNIGVLTDMADNTADPFEETDNSIMIDTTAPVITLTGDNPLLLTVGDTYTDPGATATEGVEVTPTGTVDTDTAGDYTITYTATDAAGNIGTTTRTVRVQVLLVDDTLPPRITSAKYVINDDTATITITFDEPVWFDAAGTENTPISEIATCPAGNTYETGGFILKKGRNRLTINSASFSTTKEEASVTATITSTDFRGVGPYLRYYQFIDHEAYCSRASISAVRADFQIRDVAGNMVGNEGNRVAVLRNVYAKPLSLSLEVLTTGNPSPVFAKERDVLALTFVPSAELVTAPTVTIAGKKIVSSRNSGAHAEHAAYTEIEDASDNGVYTVVYTVASDTPEGPVIYDIGEFTDIIGRTTNPSPVTSSIVVDTTAPVITLKGSKILFLNVGDTYTDPGATVDTGETVTPTGTVNTDIAGKYTISYVADDEAGNQVREKRTVTVIEFFTDIEFTSNNLVSHQAKEGDTLTLTFTVLWADPNRIPTVQIAGNDAAVEVGEVTESGRTIYTATYMVTENTPNGEVTYDIGEISYFGNVINPSANTNTNIFVDTTPPVITLTGNNPLLLTVGDTYTDPGAASEPGVTVTASPETIDTDTAGQYTITYTATDAAGNRATKERTVTVIPVPDTIAPTVSAPSFTSVLTDGYLNTEETKTSVDLIIEPVATDDGGSVTLTYALIADTAVCNDTTTGFNTDIPQTVDVPVADAAYKVCVRATDQANNNTHVTSDSFISDMVAPYLTETPTLETSNTNSAYAKEGDTLTVTFTVSEALRSTPSVTIMGQTVTPTAEENTYTATYTVTAGTPEEAVTYNIGILTDIAENTFDPSEETDSSITIDTTAPVITLNGDNPRTLTVGDTYTEEGATSDNTEEIVTPTGTVNTDTPDTYTITYTATDAAGNEATKERTVTVNPTVPKAVSDLTATATPNTVTLSWVTPGDGGATITNYQMKQGTGTYTDIAGSDDETTTHTVTGLTEQTAYTFSIRAVNSVGTGEKATAVTITTTDGSAPTVTTQDITSSNTNSAYAKEGDTLTVTFTVSEALRSTPSVTIMGQTVTPTAEENTYTATYTVTAGTPEEAVTYNIGILTDIAENTFDPSEETDSSITIDTTAPVITLNGDNPRTLTVGDTYTEEGATSDNTEEIVTPTGTVNTDTPDTYTITYTATDAAGNEATKERTVTVNPTVPKAVSDLTATATPNTVTLSWVTPGDGGATITNYQMKQGTGTYTDIAGSDDETTTHTVTGLTEQTAYTFSIRAVNSVGTGEKATAVTITTTDGSAPTVTTQDITSSNTNSAYAKEGDTLTVTFTVSEALRSTPSVTIMGQTVTPTAEENTYTATYTVTAGTPEEAVTYNIGILTDIAENTFDPSEETDSSITIDTTAPVITLNGDNPRTLTVGDTYTEEGATSDNTEEIVTPTGTVNTETAGDYTITYTATDAAGNEATKERTVTVNPTVPVSSKETTSRKSSRGRRSSGGGGGVRIRNIPTASAPKVGAQQQQVTVTVPTIPTLISTPQTITGTYRRGDVSENVRSIQKLLNQTNCPVAKTGVGSKGQETAYFGVLMKTAVQCYQTEKSLEITGAVTPELYALLIEDYTATLKAFVVYLTQLVSDIIAKKTAVVQ